MADPFAVLDALDYHDAALMRATPSSALAQSGVAGVSPAVIGGRTGIMTGIGRSRAINYLKAYREQPILRVAVALAAETYASVRWRALAPSRKSGRRGSSFWAGATPEQRQATVRALVAGGELREVQEHLFHDLWGKGNPMLNGGEQRALSIVYRLLVGESFLAMERNVAGVPYRGWILPPPWVTQTPRELGVPLYKIQPPNGGYHGIAAEDMLALKDPDPVDPYGRGAGIAGALATELEIDESMAEMDLALFRNYATPPTLILLPGATPQQAKEQTRSWQRQLQGPYRAHRTHFLEYSEGFKPEVQQLGQSPRDLLLDKQRELTFDIITRVIGRTPPELLGKVENSNRATIEAARYLYTTGFIVPLCEGDRRVLQKLASEEWDEKLVIEYDSPVPEDREFQRSVMAASPGSFMVDELRALADHPPLPDGKGQVHLMPLGVTPVLDPSADPFEDAPEAEDPDFVGGRAPRQGPWSAAYRTLPGALRAAKPNAAIDRISERHARLLERAFTAAIRDGRRRIDVGAIAAVLEAGNVQGALDLLPADLLAQRMGATESTLRSAMEQGGAEGARHLGNQLGDEIHFDASRPAARRWPSDRAGILRRWLPESARDAAKMVIDHEYLGGKLSAEETARAIRDRFGLSPKATKELGDELEALELGAPARGAHERARVTEGVRTRAADFGGMQGIGGTQEGQTQSWQQAKDDGHLGEGARVVWLTRDIGQECERCSPMHGQQRKVGETFDSSGAPELRIAHPGDAHQGWDAPCYCGTAMIAFG